MDKRDLAVLGLRLSAIYAWLQAFGYLATGVIGILLQQTLILGKLTPGNTLVFLSPTIIFLVIGFILFRFSEPLANYIQPGSDFEASEITSGSRKFATIAFGAAGLIGFFMAMPQTLQLATRWFQILHREDRTPLMMHDTFLAELGVISGVAAQFTLSVALIVGAKRFTEWWWHRQHFQP